MCAISLSGADCLKINVCSIAKKERSIYDPLYKELSKMIARYAKIDDIEIFDKKIQKAHSISQSAARQAYGEAFSPYLGKSYTIVLHPDAKMINSMEFSKLLSDKMSVNFFIGGAYGFEERFVASCDRAISLSPLTMSHKIAKAVLLEQIYRGLSIINGHPYHK